MNKVIVRVSFALIAIAVIGSLAVWQAGGRLSSFSWQWLQRTEVLSGAEIKVNPQFHDFGKVVYGQLAEYDFEISNSGGRPLEILRVSTSCGCTQAAMRQGKTSIASDESALLRVTFNPAMMEFNPGLGPVERVVYIKSNDPQKPEVEIVIKAFVVKSE